MKFKKRSILKSQTGFTLIELMVVIVILGILIGIVAPRIMDEPGKAKQVKAKVQIKALESALKTYKLDNGAYPSTEQGLLALVEAPATAKNWRKNGYLEKKNLPKDPWENEYIYLCPGVHGDFDIISYGADGVTGGENENQDINNWEIE
jgi:general secretion pathway protein G